MEKFVSESARKSLESLGRSHDSILNTNVWHECRFTPAKGVDVIVTDGEGSYSIAYFNKSGWSMQSSQFFEPVYWTALPKFNNINS